MVPIKGYKKKPLVITLIAIGFLLIPTAMPVQMFMLSGGSWPVIGEVLRSDYFLREWGLSWSAALAVYVVTRFSFAYFVSLSAVVLATKVSRTLTYPDLETPLSLLMTLFWFSAAIYFLASSLKAPYLNPKLRWWTRPQRIPLCREAAILFEKAKLPVTVLNLSLGGAFVRLDEQAAEGQRFPQRIGEEFELTMALVTGSQAEATSALFTSKAQLVWKASPESPYRSGMGIRFISLSKEQKQQLIRILRHET